MLKADTRFFDGGEYGGGGEHDRTAPGFEKHLIKREGQTDKEIIFTNPKIRMGLEFDGIAQVIKAREIPVMLLLRRDLLAMIASKELAARHGSWHIPGPRIDVTLGPRHAALMLNTAICIERCQLALIQADVPYLTLWYEELVEDRAYAHKVINRWAGTEVLLGQPTTAKMSPHLHSFVANIHDRALWARQVKLK
jgi:hypothetical protein